MFHLQRVCTSLILCRQASAFQFRFWSPRIISDSIQEPCTKGSRNGKEMLKPLTATQLEEAPWMDGSAKNLEATFRITQGKVLIFSICHRHKMNGSLPLDNNLPSLHEALGLQGSKPTASHPSPFTPHPQLLGWKANTLTCIAAPCAHVGGQ